MSLEILWFVLIAVLWVGFFFLEGFDFGVGILQLFLGRNERERGTYIFTISPHWDGNEVWLLTAGGAMLAAFPLWYAAFFSALYLPLVFLLLALIVRGVTFEVRHRADFPIARLICDIAIAAGSFTAALLFGVAMANMVIGIPLEHGNFTGTFLDLVKPYALLGGVLGLSLFLTNGALFLTLKIEGELQLRAFKFSRVSVVITVFLFAIVTLLAVGDSLLCLLSLALISGAAILVIKHYLKTAFFLVALCTACSVAALFYAMFPNVLVSSVSPEQSLTVWNAASSAYTLKLMSIVAAIFVPIIVAYQSWSYYVFRKRISPRKANVEV